LTGFVWMPQGEEEEEAEEQEQGRRVQWADRADTLPESPRGATDAPVGCALEQVRPPRTSDEKKANRDIRV
jgi:hypothetical protein